MFKRILFLATFSILVLTGHAQFTTTGSAALTSCGQWTVTPDLPNQAGSVYDGAGVDLDFDFNLSFNVNFGCDNLGASGLCFVMKTGPWAVGGGGYGMGYQGMAGNSMAVEFDTYDNGGAIWDIGADHIALMAGGNVDHNVGNPLNLSGVPTNIKPGYTNVEDCQFHLVEINWDWLSLTSQNIKVYVDGILSLDETGNYINLQFGGNSNVLWGWTASTSVQDNAQIIGFALDPNFSISATNCPGQLINFTDNSTSFNAITDWDWDFDGLGTSNLQNPSFTFAAAGSYDVSLTITDAAGCMSTAVIPVGVGFDVDPTADNSPICPGGSTVLHANAAPYVGNTCCFDIVLHDVWGDGWTGATVNYLEIYADGLLVGSYTPTNAGGGSPTVDTINLCFDHGTVIDAVIVGNNTPFECSYEILDDGGATMVSVAAGATWFDGNTQSFTVNCGITPPAYTYLWDNAGMLGGGSTNPDPTATVPSTTTFTVEVTDPGTGCTISDVVTVTTSPPVTATISGNQTVCLGSSANLQITFTGTPPFSATVAGPGGPYSLTGIMTLVHNFSVTLAGSYTLTASAGDGCTGTFSGTGNLTVITPPSVDIAASASYCDGDAIAPLTVVSGGGGTVNWYDNAALVGSLGTGMSYTPPSVIGPVTYYAATTEAVLGCVGPSDNVTITVNPIPPAPTWIGTTTYCEGDTPTPLTGQPSLGGTITWYDGMPPSTVLSTLLSFNPTLVVGTFDICITETANGCEGPSTCIPILVKPTPTAPAVAGDILYCEGETPTALTATPTIGGTIAWENSLGINVGAGTTFTPPLTNGLSSFTATETLNGCEGPATTVTIEVQPAPMVSVTNAISICLGDSVLVTALNNGYTITWSDSQAGESVYLGPDTTTMFYVTATNPLCGFAVDSIQIIVNYKPDVIAGTDTVIGIGGEVELWAESDPDVTYTWIPDPMECITTDCSEIYDVPDQATLYVVIVTDPIGCQNSDSVLVDINGYMEIFVPNIFSPNGDGENDYLVINGPRLFNYYIQVYDRWGKLVFESNEQKDYWDGKLNGSDLAPQTFVYMLSGETVLGDQIVQEGNVTIIK